MSTVQPPSFEGDPLGVDGRGLFPVPRTQGADSRRSSTSRMGSERLATVRMVDLESFFMPLRFEEPIVLYDGLARLHVGDSHVDGVGQLRFEWRRTPGVRWDFASDQIPAGYCPRSIGCSHPPHTALGGRPRPSAEADHRTRIVGHRSKAGRGTAAAGWRPAAAVGCVFSAVQCSPRTRAPGRWSWCGTPGPSPPRSWRRCPRRSSRSTTPPRHQRAAA